MARVECKLPNTRLATAELALVAIMEATAASPSDEGFSGPGWFDSSWDLHRGLDVREGLPADANLNEWLAICLGREALAPHCAAPLLHHAAPPSYRVAPRATASPRSITAIA